MKITVNESAYRPTLYMCVIMITVAAQHTHTHKIMMVNLLLISLSDVIVTLNQH